MPDPSKDSLAGAPFGSSARIRAVCDGRRIMVAFVPAHVERTFTLTGIAEAIERLDLDANDASSAPRQVGQKGVSDDGRWRVLRALLPLGANPIARVQTGHAWVYAEWRGSNGDSSSAPVGDLRHTRATCLSERQRPVRSVQSKHHKELHMSASTSARPSAGVSTRNASERLSTETKAAPKTTEFMAFVAVTIAILISAALIKGGDTTGGEGAGGTDEFTARQAWLYVAIVTAGYMLSRGLAKAGSRDPYWADGTNQNRGDTHGDHR